MSGASLGLAVEQESAIPEEQGAAPLLAMCAITKEWRNRRGTLRVLDEVDVSLAPGSVTWVCGRNGVGKTTVLRIAAGIIKPDSGSVALGDLNPERNRRAYQRNIGFLPAGDHGLYPRLTVRRHLEYWARVAFVPRADRAAAITQCVEEFGLDDLIDRRTDRMSLGQRQRLRLAMTFVHSPNVVLLDEPLNSLDSDGAAALDAALERVKGRGGAVLWCSPLGEGREPTYDASYVIANGKLHPA